MENNVLEIVELTSERVICSVNVTDLLQVAKNPAYGMGDAYVTILRDYEGSLINGWDGLEVTFVDKNGRVRARRTHSVGTDPFSTALRDTEHLLNIRGLSLYGKSMKPYKVAQVSAVWGNHWWGTLYDEFGRELNVKFLGNRGTVSLNGAFMLMLDRFNLPYYGTEYVSQYDPYSGPHPSTNCTYYIYDIDKSLDEHLRKEQEDELKED